MLDELLGSFGGGGSSKQLGSASATATSTISPIFGNNAQESVSASPVIMAGLAVVAVVFIGLLAFRH